MDKVNDNFNRLMILELFISRFYNTLFEIDMYGAKNSDMYKSTIITLKTAIEDEEKLLAMVSDEDIEEIIIYIEDNSESISKRFLKENDFSTLILKRIKKKCINKITNRKIDKNANINNEVSKDVYKDMDDIFLSFLDESINEKEEKDRIELLKYKYASIFGLDIGNEKEIIERCFNTAYSLYLQSKYISQLVNMDDITYNSIVSNICNQSLTELKNNMKKSNFSLFNKVLNYITMLKIRTVMLMLYNTDHNMYDLYLHNLFSKDGLFYSFEGMLDVEILKKDIMRHKVFIRK